MSTSVTGLDKLDPRASAAIALEEEHAAHNYHPLDVVVSHGDGACAATIPRLCAAPWVPD